MAPLTRSVHYELPELPLEAPKIEGKDIQAASYPIVLLNPEVPRLVTYKSKSGNCTCGKTSSQACADCCGNVFYCNTECQIAHWPQHKDLCDVIKHKHLCETMEERDSSDLKQITEDLGKIISSDFKSLDYTMDPKLSINIDKTAAFGDFYDVSENSDNTIRKFYSGTYRCTSVIPDENCAPVTIYHHELVDPTKVMKQCILMSKDFFEHTDMPNQVTMPEWCNWESADEEYIPSDSESEYSDSEVSDEFKTFTEFVERVFDDKPGMESDSEDKEYDPSDSDSDDFASSDESDVSDHELDYLISEGKQCIENLPQKRQSIAPTADMEVVEEDLDEGEDSEVEAYKDFKEKVFETEHKFTSDIDDSDYLPYSESDSDSGESIPERDISDSERCISDNEVENILEAGKDIRDLDEEFYDQFIENTLDKDHIEESDAEDEDYIPADVDSDSSEDDEISDSEEKDLLEESRIFIKDLTGKRLSYQTEFSSSDESETDSEVSSEGELYEDFKIHTENKHDLSDTEDVEYIPEHSDSETSSSSSEDEMEISDAESDAIVDASKVEVAEVSGNKRKCNPTEDCQDSDNEAEMASDDELLYNAFRSKLVVSDPSKMEDLGDSDDEEFVPPTESQDDSQDDSQDESQDSQDEYQEDSQDEGSQASEKSAEEMDVSDAEIDDLEISSEDELYEEFKDEVCKTQRKAQAHVSKSQKSPTENNEIIYFMNSLYTSSLKDSLENGKMEKGSRISGSFLLKDGSKLTGIGVEMKGQNWRAAHAFEDSTSGKCFAVVVTTDPWEHFSNNHEHLEAQYPEQKWSSVAETGLKFEMKDFCSA